MSTPRTIYRVLVYQEDLAPAEEWLDTTLDRSIGGVSEIWRPFPDAVREIYRGEDNPLIPSAAQVRDAARWKKLIALVGTPANASDVIVKLFWDDATMTPFIIVGKEGEYYIDRGSFAAVIDSIPEPED